MSARIEAVLNELSVVPSDRSTDDRVTTLAFVLRKLSRLGLPRVLRHTETALELSVGDDQSLRRTLFSRAIPREARQLITGWMNKSPYVRELHQQEEGEDRSVSVQFGETEAHGLGLATIGEHISVSLLGVNAFEQPFILVDVTELDSNEQGDISETNQTRKAHNVARPADVDIHAHWLQTRVLDSALTGKQLVDLISNELNNVKLGPKAEKQLLELSGKELGFSQIAFHLYMLHLGVHDWKQGEFSPTGPIDWSRESNATLQHKRLGPMRDLPVPADCKPRRFSFHTKIHSSQWRIYFAPESSGNRRAVIVGYVGPHLPTFNFRT